MEKFDWSSLLYSKGNKLMNIVNNVNHVYSQLNDSTIRYEDYITIIIQDCKTISFNMSCFIEHMHYNSKTLNEHFDNDFYINDASNNLKLVELNELKKEFNYQEEEYKDTYIPKNLLNHYMTNWLPFNSYNDYSKDILLLLMQIKIEEISSKEI